MKSRLLAAGLHLLMSAGIAAAAWALVFLFWYPQPLAKLVGGLDLFLLLVGVDLVLGPVLTLVVASPRKPRRELLRDISVIVFIQAAAGIYGLHAMSLARPVAVVFEIDQFRVVSASDIDAQRLADIPKSLGGLSWTGPRLLAAQKPSGDEQLRTIEIELAGTPLAALPRHWRNYEEFTGLAWERASPIAKLLSQQPNLKREIDKIASRAQVDPASLRVLPLLARRAEGTVLLAPGGGVAGMLAATPPQ